MKRRCDRGKRTIFDDVSESAVAAAWHLANRDLVEVAGHSGTRSGLPGWRIGHERISGVGDEDG